MLKMWTLLSLEISLISPKEIKKNLNSLNKELISKVHMLKSLHKLLEIVWTSPFRSLILILQGLYLN